MGKTVVKGQWIVLPYDLVKDLKDLRISPIGVVPQHNRRPWTITDLSQYGTNAETVKLAPLELMQFGAALPRLLVRIVHADPRHGLVYVYKGDYDDSFYRVYLDINDIPKVAVAFPPDADKNKRVTFPVVLLIGYGESVP